MNISHSEIQTKIAGWQQELRRLTGNDSLVIIAHEEPKCQRSMEDIIQVVCEETGVNINTIRSKTRIRGVVLARHLISYYAKRCTGLSLQQIGYALGGNDHTTVIHANRSIKDLIETEDIAVCGAIAKINMRLELLTENGNV
jgi:chromosomal replication initiation ATPase DnaA